MPIAGRGGPARQTVTRCGAKHGAGGANSRRATAGAAGRPRVAGGCDTTKVIERVAATYDGWLPYLPDVNAYARAWDRIRAKAVREFTPALYATVT
jgi:hypothetical protein